MVGFACFAVHDIAHAGLKPDEVPIPMPSTMFDCDGRITGVRVEDRGYGPSQVIRVGKVRDGTIDDVFRPITKHLPHSGRYKSGYTISVMPRDHVRRLFHDETIGSFTFSQLPLGGNFARDFTYHTQKADNRTVRTAFDFAMCVKRTFFAFQIPGARAVMEGTSRRHSRPDFAVHRVAIIGMDALHEIRSGRANRRRVDAHQGKKARRPVLQPRTQFVTPVADMGRALGQREMGAEFQLLRNIQAAAFRGGVIAGI